MHRQRSQVAGAASGSGPDVAAKRPPTIKSEEATGASTATISRVKRCLEYGEGGYDEVLQRIEEAQKRKQTNNRPEGLFFLCGT